MKKIFLSVVFWAGLCNAFALADNSNNGVNSVLATVNGQVITLVDVLPLTQAKELQAHSVYSGERLKNVIADYRKKVVNELIDDLLVQAEFARHNFVLSSHDIEREIDQFAQRIGCRSREQLLRKLRKDGSSIEEIRMGIRKNMMVQLMLFRQIRIADPVTPKELYEYFKANEADYASPEKVGLAMLKLDSSRKDLERVIPEISAELKKNPENFSGIVKRYAPEFKNGDLGEIDSKLLRPEFAAAFKSFSPGMVAGPLKVYDGIVWLKVTSWSPAKKSGFHEVEERIKNDLERKKREAVVTQYIKKLRSNAVIEFF